MTLPLLQGGPGSPVEPLVGPSDTERSTLEDTAEPLTASPSTVVDKWGLYWVVPDDEEASESSSGGQTGVSGSIQMAATAGLRNGDFAHGPPDPDSPISDEDNPLPHWSLVHERGECIDVTWVEDADAPSGYALLWEARTGVEVIDQSYIEQVIPVSGAEDVRGLTLRVGDTVSPDNVYWFREIQPLKADGTPTGTAAPSFEFGWEWGTAAYDANEAAVAPLTAIPDDAAYLRVRVGAIVDAVSAPTAQQSALMQSVWCGPSVGIQYVTLILEEHDSLPATGTKALYMGDVAYGRFIAHSPGWVASVSVRIKDTWTSGSLDFFAWNETSGTQVGNEATINTGHRDDSYARSAYDPVTNVIYKGDIIRGACSVASGTFGPTTNGAVLVAVLALCPWVT
jgi:hypothetical protein